MSESGIPLYPPTALWSALMSERLSRINVCNGFRVRRRRPRALPRDSRRWWEAQRGRAQPPHSACVAEPTMKGGIIGRLESLANPLAKHAPVSVARISRAHSPQDPRHCML